MSRIALLHFVVGLMIAFQGCVSMDKHGLSAQDNTAQQHITSAWQAAVNAKDWNAVAAIYSDDAVLMPPNGPSITGRENIRDFFVGFPPIRDMKLQLVEIAGRGDMAYVYGTYSMSIVLPGHSPIHDVGKCIEIRRKQSDGTWLITRDMFNSDLPASH